MTALLLTLVVLSGLAGTVAGFAALPGWQHLPRRFIFIAIGAVACAKVALIAIAALIDGARFLTWRDTLQTLPDLVLPLGFVLLVQAYRRNDALQARVEHAAPVNIRTSLPNRPLLLAQAMPALARCQRDLLPATVVVARIDGLRELEAARGTQAADALLRDFANLFRDATRAGDVPGHATRDVLAALLPSTTTEAARGMADRLRHQASTRLAHPGMDGRRVTVSLGMAPVGDGPARAVLDEAIAAAEGALTSAEAAGGDRALEAPSPPLRSAGQPL